MGKRGSGKPVPGIEPPPHAPSPTAPLYYLKTRIQNTFFVVFNPPPGPANLIVLQYTGETK